VSSTENSEFMDETLTHYQALLQGLKACEINYRSHVAKLGAITDQELALWIGQTEDMTPQNITKAFKLHIQHSSFYPTVADIRNAQANHKPRHKPKLFKALDAPDSRKPMPENVKKFLKHFAELKSIDNIKKTDLTTK
jgi:hypothetical protein